MVDTVFDTGLASSFIEQLAKHAVPNLIAQKEQSVQYLWDYETMLETGIVRANEC